MTASPPVGASPAILEQGARLRRRLAAGGPLGRASIGTVPILWNNVDIAELRLGTTAETILDDIARTGYDGCQLGLGFPEGDALRSTLAARDLRLAEVYASIPATVDGPIGGALERGPRAAPPLGRSGGGEVLCIAFDGSPDRDPWAGEPRDAGDAAAHGRRLERDARAARDDREPRRAAAGARIAFHPHAGTYVETPDEVEQLASSIAAATSRSVSTSGTTSSAAAIRSTRSGATARGSSHVHLKDVDPEVLDGLRDGSVGGFGGGDPAAPVHRARGRRARPRRGRSRPSPSDATTAG